MKLWGTARAHVGLVMVAVDGEGARGGERGIVQVALERELRFGCEIGPGTAALAPVSEGARCKITKGHGILRVHCCEQRCDAQW